MSTKESIGQYGFHNMYCNIRPRVREDKEAMEIAKKNTQLFREAYKKDPSPLRVIDNHYLDRVLTQALNDNDYIIMSGRAWKAIHEAYPSLFLDYRMLLPLDERQAYADFCTSTEILKDFQKEILQKKGNTIVSKKFTPEEIIKSVKAELNLEVEVREFREHPDQKFYLVETLEVARKLESKNKNYTWHA